MAWVTWASGAHKDTFGPELIDQVAEALLDGAVEVAHRQEVLAVRDDVVRRHDRGGLTQGPQPFSVVEGHALGAFEVQEVAQGLFAKGEQSQFDRGRVVPCRLGQVGAREVRGGPQGSQHVGGQRQVEHFLARYAEDGGPPAVDGRSLLLAQPLIGAFLQAEGREQVLAHQGVLQLGRGADHVDERLAVLDDERRLGGRSGRCRYRPPGLDYV